MWLWFCTFRLFSQSCWKHFLITEKLAWGKIIKRSSISIFWMVFNLSIKLIAKMERHFPPKLRDNSSNYWEIEKFSTLCSRIIIRCVTLTFMFDRSRKCINLMFTTIPSVIRGNTLQRIYKIWILVISVRFWK